MTRITEAIYTHGVLKPTADLELREQQRVRVIVEPIEKCGEEHDQDRAAAVARLKAGIGGMKFFSNGQLPTRDELHDRV
jgi:predicted DNA-binding antitoxin AbrB/MazE fold protein